MKLPRFLPQAGRCALLVFLAAQATRGFPLLAWTPGTGNPAAVQGFVVDPANRTDVLAFYNTIYPASENYAANMAWTGNVGSGVAGTTSAAFKDDVRRRINLFRALVGLPADITFDATKNDKDQQAALMMSRNNALNHTPPASWLSYTAAGAEAAGASNLALGSYGPGAVNNFMLDNGGGNEVGGHRRWFLYSRAQSMGTGDIPSGGGFNSANAIWVIGNFKAAPAPQFVAWPNHGFSPFPLMPARWSLSYPGANFASATVTMTQAGNNVPLTVISRTDNGYGDNTIIWTPTGLPGSISADTTYNVSIAAISGSGVPTSYNYSVTLFDPNVLGDAVTIAGTNTPPATGSTYTFNAIAQADAYELQVTTASTVAWTEGAEDAPTPRIQESITGGYALRQTAVKRAPSAKAFQLTFGTFADQNFQITRDLVPTATSQLQWYDLARFSAATSTLRAEVSTNGGSSWTSVFSRPGVGNSSANFDSAFSARNISLASYAGQIIRVRFILRHNNAGAFVGADSNHGFFIDDIAVTNASELINATTTALAGSATSFTLNATTAGAALAAGTSYYLRIRPKVGTKFFEFGATKIVTVQAATGYAGWIAANYPSVTGGPGGDHERDGFVNGVEYAFALNPTISNPATALPQPNRTGNNYGVTFTQPAGVTGVTYGAQWSPDLVTWNTLPDTGSGSVHTFTANIANQPQAFFRHVITIAP